jgi:hypothetical protein
MKKMARNRLLTTSSLLGGWKCLPVIYLTTKDSRNIDEQNECPAADWSAKGGLNGCHRGIRLSGR